jgi:hypothetical protein
MSTLTQILGVLIDDGCLDILTDSEIERVFEMIKANIFRECPEIPAVMLYCEVPPTVFEPTWPHLDIVYTMLYRMQCIVPHHQAFDQDFLNQMYKLFGTADSNERREIGTFMTAYVMKHPEERDEILCRLSDMVLVHVETHDRPFHVLTALPIMLSIFETNGECHPYFYATIEHSILPLIHDPFVFFFNIQLVNILEYYMEHSASHIAVVFEEVIQYWPHTSVSKMAMYTMILIDYFGKLNEEDQARFLPSVFSIFSRNCASPSPKIAEVTYSWFLSADFDQIVMRFREKIIEIMVPNMIHGMLDHWEETVRDRATLCMGILEKLDASLVKKYSVKAFAVSSQEHDWNKRNAWAAIAHRAEERAAMDVEKVLHDVDEMFGRFQEPVMDSGVDEGVDNEVNL